MAQVNTAVSFGKQIRTLFDAGTLGAMPDRGLLDHFARGGESSEAAFATLVERHGTMVLRVCRQLLADGHLAEDAFQVTFMLLVRRARSIHNPDSLAGWLHRVARRVALRAMGKIRLRMDRECPQLGEIAAVAADDDVERAELCAIVHEEIDRLANSQRLPILLCALEGLSHEEAARQLRWPVGTVKSRLVRGRRRLEGRLARRGLAPAVALVAGSAATSATAAPVPLALAVAATRLALQGTDVASRSAGAVSLSGSSSISLLLQKELSALFLVKVALTSAVSLAACVVVGVIGLSLASPASQPVRAIDTQVYRARAGEPKSPTISPKKAFTIVNQTDRNAAKIQPENPRKLTANPVAVVEEHRLSPFGEQVERAIRRGVRFLKSQQRDDGSWLDVEIESRTGTTSLVTLALVSAGEKPDSPAVRKALEYLRRFGPDQLRSTYAISLQTQVFAAAEPARDQLRIAANVRWLESAQMSQADRQFSPGAWTYSDFKRARPGDNSNTQFALVGLSAASDAGLPVKLIVWKLSRFYWERTQKRDGSWAYTADGIHSTASMTCAGVASMVIAGRGGIPGRESLHGETIHDCGKGAVDRKLQAGIDWVGSHFRVGENFGGGKQWKFYYLYGLERAGRLAGIRYFGEHDWFRLGAEELVECQNKLGGYWQGALVESEKVLATSFAVLFLAKGRAPVLINKLRHGPAEDWNNDPDDVRNLVSDVATDWKHLLTWQVVDSRKATVADLLRAPILFINGHDATEFTIPEKNKLLEYVERGGSIFAEACCGSPDFDKGFRKLIEELFPDKQDELRPLADDHPIWQSRYVLPSEIHPLCGVKRGNRTVIVYSPKDLSCYWNQAKGSSANPAVIKALKIGHNVVDALTGRKLPPDKLSDP
jgi:RNA polymerase sigma factor (sigma-70 family)